MKLARASVAVVSLCALVHGLNGCDDDTDVTQAKDGGSPESSTSPPDSSANNNDSSQPAVDAGSINVTLRFKAKVGTQDFACGTAYPNQGAPGSMVEPSDLRFFVQDLKLIDDKGALAPVTFETRAPWQTPDVALLDFENGTGGCSNGNPDLNDKVTGTAPGGRTYTGIVFSNGVPESLNHQDPATAPAPLTAGGMTWGWLLGHLFIKAEMKSANDAGGVGLLHLGSVGCNNSPDGGDDYMKSPTAPCKQQNRNEVRFTTFNLATNVVVFDVGMLFSSTNLATSSQCHSGGAACPPLFANVGLDFDGGARMGSHPAFRVE